MILFIDDEPRRLASYIEEVSRTGFETAIVTSVKELQTFLNKSETSPQCIVLDIMFPTDRSLPDALTSHGLTAGIPLFASLRSRFPQTPILVFTNFTSTQVKSFFRRQDRCSFYYKSDLLPFELAKVVADLANDRGQILLDKLKACGFGRVHARQFESVGASILEYLFVPPLQRVIFQSRRADGQEVRDVVLPNSAPNFFWSSLRRELNAKYIIAEFKNYRKPVGKAEVGQLREYLARKSVGRFGLLISRLPPSASALRARADGYSDQDCLIILLHDADLRAMIEISRRSGDPATVLERMKEEFELGY